MENNQENDIILSVRNLCQYFKLGHKELKAVDNFSLDVHKGEVVGLVGESGCGKTTTGRSIIKLYDITSGDIYFKGQRIAAGIRSYTDEKKKLRKEAKEKIAKLEDELKDNPEELKAEKDKINEELSVKISELNQKIASARYDHKNCDKEYSKKLQEEVIAKYEPLLNDSKDNPEEYAKINKEFKSELRIAKKTKLVTQIQMIFQDPIASLNPRMTVQDIIEEGLVIKGVRDKEYLREEVGKILETVGLVREHASRYPHEFSGGQRQRIGIARSVIMKPDMIIADEPVSALDVSIQAQVINLLNDLRHQLGLTILFIAHDLSVVKYFSDRIAVMYFGKMVELTTSDELFAHPVHPYTRSLLSAIPLPDPIYEKSRVRIQYNPVAEHDYSVDKPSLRELVPGHFVYCNDEEEKRYKKEFFNIEG